MDTLTYDHHTASGHSITIPTMQNATTITRLTSTLTSLLDTYTTHLHILTTLLTLTLPIILLLYIHRDYKSFLSLGPGGTPSTPLGYLKIKLLSILSLRDPLRPLPVPLHFRPQHGYLTYASSTSSTTAPASLGLTELPKRQGPRPKIYGIAPQRQQTQKSPPSIYTSLCTSLATLASHAPNNLLQRTSCFEKHSSGLFTKHPLTRSPCGAEICHAHPSDGSLHLSLHPADIRVLIESGWGERHPLAKGGWFRRFVPREFVLVYAPRGWRRQRGEEMLVVVVVVVGRWVRGAAWWWRGSVGRAGCMGVGMRCGMAWLRRRKGFTTDRWREGGLRGEV
ncbi:hypothetical protein K491DRAFT_628151 [Lophiostoma macrostomum CBS 122681]|uniref:Luciferase domain-containing protein n=1 Tax=Lophiostoma macrostomum CBS 122681 TaxID=1314788 RepID=A0A6A6TB85_9PLEO|nr:hypothetical protein K491DRAFT_628151 [Lophiostoma macrostomum CBS 122681]